MTHERKCAVVFKCFCFLFHGIHMNFAQSCCGGGTRCSDFSPPHGIFESIHSNNKYADFVCNSGYSLDHSSTTNQLCCCSPLPSCVQDETTTDNDETHQSSTSYITISTSTPTSSTVSTTLSIIETPSSSTLSTNMPSVGNSNSSTILQTSFLHTSFESPVSTVSTPPLTTPKLMVSTTISNFQPTETETTQHSSKLYTATVRTEYSKQGSLPTSGSVGIAFGVLILLVAFIVGLIILRRKQRGGTLFGKKQSDFLGSKILSNAAYDPHAPSVDNVSMTSKDSGLGKHDESGEEEQMDGEYNTIMVHYPDVNQQIENTYNLMDGSPTADSTYSHIPNSKDALFDNTYSHMANGKPLKALEPSDTDTIYNHLGDSSCNKHKNKKEETYNDTYNHTQINPGCPKTDPDDQDDNYSHINQQESNAGKYQADVQGPTKATTIYDKMNAFTMIAAERTKQYDESVNSSVTNAEGVNNAEGHTYFVLESNANQHPKKAPYDYAVVAMPEKDRTDVDPPTDPQHEYFVIEPATEL